MRRRTLYCLRRRDTVDSRNPAPWERLCIYIGAALLLSSVLLLALGLEVRSAVPAALRFGTPGLVVLAALVLIGALVAALHQWKDWIRWFLFFKPWTAPLLGGGWSLLVFGLGWMFVAAPSPPGSAVPPALPLSTLSILSGFALNGLFFMANADRFAFRYYTDLCSKPRECRSCKRVDTPKDGRCPSCGDEAPLRESIKLGAYMFGGVPASVAIGGLFMAHFGDAEAFGLGLVVWVCAGLAFYKILRRKVAGKKWTLEGR